MTSRLLAALGLASLMVGLASAQDKPTLLDKPSAEAAVKKALEAAGDDLPKAISILEAAQKQFPDSREVIFLLGAMSVVQGEDTKVQADRIALFHKSTAAFARLSQLGKELKPNEKGFMGRSQIGEARALSLEGKTQESLATIKKAMTLGFDDLDSLESEKDLERVRKLPEYRAAVEAAYKASIAEQKKEVAEEISQTKAFPFDFELKDTDDKTVALADYKGKVTIVDVWGTWCPPCRKEIPHFVDLLKQYKDKGLEIVGINCNEEGTRDEVKATIKDFAKKNKVEYRCLLNDDKTEGKIPGFQGYPTTLFLDRSGKVRLMLVGYTPKARLEAIIATLLDEPAKGK